MPESSAQESLDKRLTQVHQILESGTTQQAVRMLNALHPAEIADLLESSPLKLRKLLWRSVDAESHGLVLVELGEEVRETLVNEMSSEEILSVVEGMEVDDLADFYQSLPDKVQQETLQGMDKQNRARLEAVVSYLEDSAGGLMDTDVITVRANVSLDVVMRYLRMRGDIPAHTNLLFVVDRYGKYRGVLSLRRLLTENPDSLVAEVMRTDMEGIAADTSAADVAHLFEDRDFVSTPVVDENGVLLGRITIDDVVDVIREEAGQPMMSMAGLNEESDIFAPVIASSKRRAVWLGLNLLTAFAAAWVIGRFEATLEQIVALAILMPIVASMGGIAGSQTLTLVIRGQALGQIGRRNMTWLLNRELGVAFLNGLLWSAVVAITAVLWFDNLKLGYVIGAAMVVNLLTAALCGVIIPVSLKRMGIDPALAGGVILTTITDIVGFVTFLGLATMFLLG